MSKPWRPRQSITLIPLIDVLVNVLFFFVVFGNFDQGAAALPIKSPGSSTAPPVKVERMVVSLDQQGQYTVDGQPVTAEAIPGLVAAALAKDSATQIVVFPDEAVPYTKLVEALDLVREGGAERPALGVRPIEARTGRGENFGAKAP